MLALVSALAFAAAGLAVAVLKAPGARRAAPPAFRNLLVIVDDAPDALDARLQRRALAPDAPALAASGWRVLELYGEETPLLNGVPSAFDATLLRAVLDIDNGFRFVRIDGEGRVTLDAREPTARPAPAPASATVGRAASRGVAATAAAAA